MAIIVPRRKEQAIGLQTYTLIDAIPKDIICQCCGKEGLAQGYYCVKHKSMFCAECMSSKGRKLIKCKGVSIYNPLLINKNAVNMQCIYVPISEIFLKEDGKSNS